MSGVVVGIDGGGTKTRIAVLAPMGPVPEKVAHGDAGPSNIAAVGVADAFANIAQAASTALGRALSERESVLAVSAGIAGYSHAQRREELHRALSRLFPNAQVEVVPDYVAAHCGALAAGPGIVVIAGTGSVAFGTDESGATHRSGAYGYLIDDAGSGYGVGRRALSAVLRAKDGTGPATSLSDALADDLGTTNWEDIIAGVYGGPIDRVRIAMLARCVSATASGGDGVAKAILADAGHDLAALAIAVAGALRFNGFPIRIATIGSLWDSGAVLSDAFKKALTDASINHAVQTPTHDPSIGAALRARNMLGG